MAARAQQKLKEKEKESRRPRERRSRQDGPVVPIPPRGAPAGFNPPRVPETPRSGIFADSDPITIQAMQDLPRTPLPGPRVSIPPPAQRQTPPPAAARAQPLPPMNPALLQIAQERGIPISGQMAQAQPISIPPRQTPPPIRAMPPSTFGMEPPIPPMPTVPGPNPLRQPTMGNNPGPTLPGEPTVGPPRPMNLQAGATPPAATPTLSRGLPVGLPPTQPGQAPLLQNTIAPIVRNAQPAGMTPTVFDTGGMSPNPGGPPAGPLSPAESITMGPQRVAQPPPEMEDLIPFLQQMGIRQQQAPITQFRPPQYVTGSRIPR